MNLYDFHRGTSPLLISIPHSGTALPEALAHRLTVVGRTVPDTDWYVDLLYDFARGLGASIIKANYSRYVVDLNRSPDSASLYEGAPTSPVCPTESFGGSFIYMAGHAPDEREIASRIDEYWRPYHGRIAIELAQMRAAYGKALLWDAHSIASEIPGLFEGVLPEFNLGTRDGASCPREISEALLHIVARDGEFGVVLDGRFKGGYITDHYGKPADGVYAVQLELARRAYMNEAVEQVWDPQRAERAQALISRLLSRYLSS
jgi:N-formylglutamate deformylase